MQNPSGKVLTKKEFGIANRGKNDLRKRQS